MSKVTDNIRKIMKEKGISQAELAKRIGTTQMSVSRNLLAKNGMYASTLEKYIEALGCDANAIFGGPTKIDLAEFYPYNLVVDVFDGDKTVLDKLYLPNLYAAIDELSPGLKSVIKMLYEDHMTEEECGKALGLTRQGVSCRKFKMLHLLRVREKRFHYIVDVNELYDRIRELEIVVDNLQRTNPEDPTIDDLDLSVRAFNCLKRGGFEYMSDFEGVSPDTLVNIRGMGPKTLTEVLDKLKEYGYKFVEVEECDDRL